MPKWVAQMWSFHRGVQLWGVSKNRGKTPKMDDDDNGNPYFLMDDLEGKPTIFGNTHLWISTQTWKSDGIFVSKKLLPCEQTRRMCWTDGVYDSHENLRSSNAMGYAKQWLFMQNPTGFLTHRWFWRPKRFAGKEPILLYYFLHKGTLQNKLWTTTCEGSSRRSTIHLYFKLNKLDKKQDEFLAVPHRMVGPCKTPLGPKHHSLEGAGRDTP